MKRAAAFLFVLVACGCAPAIAAAAAPSVQYQSTIVHNHEAILRFAVDTGGLPTEYSFDWGPTTAYGELKETYEDGPIPASTEPQQFEFVLPPPYLPPLEAGAEYHYRISVENEDGEEVGADQAFTTTNGLPPAVATGAASEEGESSATLNGTVDPEGSPLTACRFRVIDDTTWRNKGFVANDVTPPLPLGSTVPCAESLATIGSGTEAVPVHADLSGLDPGAYHFRLEAENQYEEAAGAGEAFSTSPGPPSVEYGTVDPIRNHEATLHFSIDPGGLETEFEVEYARVGEEVRDWGMPGLVAAGDDPVPLAVTIPRYWEGSLSAGQEFHWRVRAWNAAGETIAADQLFTTTDGPRPGVANGTATQTGDGTVELTATVDPEGVPLTSCEFRYLDEGSYYHGFDWHDATGPIRIGPTVPCSESLGEIGSGTEPVVVHAEVSGLDPGEHFFRIEADNQYESSALLAGTPFTVEASSSPGSGPSVPPGGDAPGLSTAPGLESAPGLSKAPGLRKARKRAHRRFRRNATLAARLARFK